MVNILEVDLLGSKPAMTPMEQNHRHLTHAASSMLYRRLVGHLAYLVVPRPDFTYSVYVLSQFMQEPRKVKVYSYPRTMNFC